MKKVTLFPLILSALVLASCGGGNNPDSSKATGLTTPDKSSDTSHATGLTTPNTQATEGAYKVTFDYNYEGGPASEVVKVNAFDAVKKPADPTRTGYSFVGWMKEADDHIFDFENMPFLEDSDVTLKAFWIPDSLKETVFEAEYCACITDGLGMQGSTYSGGTQGKALIGEDVYGDYHASNDFFVHFLYMKGNTLTFDLVADKAEQNVVFAIRLSAEYRETIEITNEKWKVKINDEALAYKPFTFRHVPPQGGTRYPFTDYVLGNINLKEGENKIELITDNDELLYGTAASTAPMIDCLKMYSGNTITWPTAKESNID